MYRQQSTHFGSLYGQRPVPSAGGYAQHFPQQQQPLKFDSGLSRVASMQTPLQSSMIAIHSSGGYTSVTGCNSDGGRAASSLGTPDLVPPAAAVPTRHATVAQAPVTLLQCQQQTKAQQAAPGQTAQDIEEGGPADQRPIIQDDKCGGESAGPKTSMFACGWLRQYGRAMGLLGSTILSGWCQVFVLLPALGDFLGIDFVGLQIAFGLVWLAAIALVVNGICSDPGQMKSEEWSAAKAKAKQLRDEESGSSDDEGEPMLPHRSHKTWRYARPVMRYDHYCRWLGNSIGLLNHRQFVCLLAVLLTVGLFGVLVDGFVLFNIGRKLFGAGSRGLLSADLLIALAHAAYSTVVSYYVFGVLKIHVALVSRNETAHEWNSNSSWRFDRSRHGPATRQEDMSEREQDELKGSERYYAELNAWDKGIVSNCMGFWLHARCDEHGNLDGNF